MQQLTSLTLADGETYVGAIGDQQGSVYHLILLAGDNDDATWQAQKEWAASIGGDLPTRVEQAMLFERCADQFQKDWYWSNQEHAADPAYAWYQYFHNGGQSCYRKGTELRARAVRRLVLE